MGLFCVALEKTDKEYIECAIGNLKIYLEYINSENKPDYLLDFASGYIEKVKKNNPSLSQ